MAEHTTMDAIKMAAAGDVANFRSAVSDIMMDKIYDAVELKKHEVSASFMSDEEQTETQETEDVD